MFRVHEIESSWKLNLFPQIQFKISQILNVSEFYDFSLNFNNWNQLTS